MNRLQRGSHVLIILIVVAVIGIIGALAWVFVSNMKDSDQSDSTPLSQVDTPPSELIWQQGEVGWQSTSTPPECPAQPIMKSPADISKATGVLYPGQTRGGNYKPHGGFRFDNNKNADITVTAPLDGFIVRGGSYLAEGEVQYTFDIMNNCGIMYRLGHLRVLPDNLQKIADTWPAPTADSRTQSLNPVVYVKAGDTLATSVGITETVNAFFDWGVYDYRQENEASKSIAYQQLHAQDKELSWHAVCWFDWLPSADSSKVKSLPPGDPTSGKNSDYCR
ncbi:MAG: hypothetical protein WA030_04125 [Candidatus Microsaccharimonas sp.]